MKSLKYPLWAAGNILLAIFVILASWAGTYAAAVLVPGSWIVAVLFSLILPVGTVLWPGWLLGQAGMSIALARLKKPGKLAHLRWDRYGATIELDTTDSSVLRLQKLGVALMLPGRQGVLAAYLLTVSGGLALNGTLVFGWPLWASALFLIPWGVGWLVYSKSVRARL